MDNPVYRPFLDEREANKLSQVIESGWLSSKGKQTEEFENRVKNFLKTDNGLATDSGTAALQIGLEALDVEGGEVIIPGLTFGATALAVKQAGAKPIPVDIEEDSLGIDPEKVEEAISEKTEAVVVVHLFGHAAKVDELKTVCDRHDIPLVEDAAQAFGTEHRDRMLGTIGDIGAFSFSWNKTVTTGKGGFITAKDEHMDRIRELVCNGQRARKFDTEGYNYRIDSIRASVGNSQMEKIEEITEKKEKVFEAYGRELSGLEGLRTPEIDDNTEPWVYHVIVENAAEISERLEKEGIGTRRFYRPLNKVGIVETEKELSVSSRISEKGLMLPSSPDLAEDVQEVAEKIRDVAEEVNGK